MYICMDVYRVRQRMVRAMPLNKPIYFIIPRPPILRPPLPQGTNCRRALLLVIPLHIPPATPGPLLPPPHSLNPLPRCRRHWAAAA